MNVHYYKSDMGSRSVTNVQTSQLKDSEELLKTSLNHKFCTYTHDTALSTQKLTHGSSFVVMHIFTA